MTFADFPAQKSVVELLQRSLERGRLGHAYLFTGHQLSLLESVARTLAKTLNCRQPVRRSPSGPPLDCCDKCLACRRIDEHNFADVHWARPESKSRIIKVEQVRDLMHEIQLKPAEAEYKVAIIVAADRLNAQSANAFLKTLEEPPPKSVIILLTTEPQRLLETIVSRCLRLNFSGDDAQLLSDAQLEWLKGFSEVAAAEQKSLLGRYRLLGVLLKRLGEIKSDIEAAQTAQSPLEKYDNADPEIREKWEDELAAAIEAEYRLQRSDLLAAVHWWLRDVWLRALPVEDKLLNFPLLTSAARVAGRISAERAGENLRVIERTQKLLWSNVQEALALEVGLLKLNL
jgi:DNA polymerase-3 subunit delta'